MKNMNEFLNGTWITLKSPRVVALLKLGAALVGVVHAIDELINTPKSPHARPMGFRHEKK